LQSRSNVRCLTYDTLFLRGSLSDQIANDNQSRGDADANL
jgi:hypothetical protein